MATRVVTVRLDGARETVVEIGRVFAKHGLLTYASAIAFRTLVALVPLTLLGLALLGAFGLRGVWRDTIAPAVQGQVTLPVYQAINFSVEKILATDATSLIALASVLVVWDMTWAVNTVMAALNEIHEVDERRSKIRRIGTAAGLGIAVTVCLIAAVLTLAVLPGLAGGALDILFSVVRWPVALAFLALAVGLLMRYGPSEKPEVRWASGGSLLVVGAWVVASLGFRWWVTDVANFESAVGSLTVFLVLTSYVLVSAAIFLVGAQLNELARKKNARS